MDQRYQENNAQRKSAEKLKVNTYGKAKQSGQSDKESMLICFKYFQTSISAVVTTEAAREGQEGIAGAKEER